MLPPRLAAPLLLAVLVCAGCRHWHVCSNVMPISLALPCFSVIRTTTLMAPWRLSRSWQPSAISLGAPGMECNNGWLC